MDDELIKERCVSLANHMDKIKALIKIKQLIGSKKRRNVKASKVEEMEKIISKNLEISDSEICKKLYGDDKKSSGYRSLKFRLEEKLTNDIFLYASNFTHDKKQSFKTLIAEKNYIVGATLQKYGFRFEAIKMLEKNLEYCKRNSFTDIALMTVQILHDHYGFVAPNTAKMHSLLNESDKLMEVYQAEKYIRKCNAIISNMYVSNKGGFKDDQIEQMDSMIVRINEILTKYSSRTIYYFSYDLLCFYHTLKNEFETCLEKANEGLEICQKEFPKDLHFIYTLKINIAVSNFHLNQYEESEKYFVEALSLSKSGNRVWFHNNSLYFMTLVRMKSYKKLIRLFLEVKKYNSLSNFVVQDEQWKIREAYLNFLVLLNKIEDAEEEISNLPSFSSSRFINSVPYYTKDKSGQHVTIIILKILFLLSRKKYDMVEDLSESLTQYTYKYLKNNETLRSNCFIKMLIKMTKAGFHPVRTQAYVKELYHRMAAARVTIDEKSNMIEIIPYEELWDNVIDILYINLKK